MSEDNIVVRTMCGRRDMLIAALSEFEWRIRLYVFILYGLLFVAVGFWCWPSAVPGQPHKITQWLEKRLAARSTTVLYEAKCYARKSDDPCADNDVAALQKATQTAYQRRMTSLPMIAEDNSDILMKFVQSETYSGQATVTLNVFAAEDNSKLWEKSRTVLDINNDVTRLLSALADVRADVIKAQREVAN